VSAGVEACDSTDSSPMTLRRSIPEEVSFKAFKKVLEGPSQREREDEDAKKKKIQVTFKIISEQFHRFSKSLFPNYR
jgi:hypothetical protein